MPSNLKPYDRVRVLSDRFATQGVDAGAIGFVIEEPRNNRYLVEVSRPDGTTIALISAAPSEVEKVDRMSLRPPPPLSAEDREALERRTEVYCAIIWEAAPVAPPKPRLRWLRWS